MQRKLWAPLGCALLVGVCLLIAQPWAELGVNDDWAYIYSAQILARSGEIRYSGWGSMPLSWQLLYGALWTLLLGPSFTAPRVGVMVLAMALAALLVALGRRLGLRDAQASLVALTVALSPVLLPWSASFMSDVPSLFAGVGCLYCMIRAVQAETPGTVHGWLAAGAATGFMAGSCRQIYLPWALLPALVVAWQRRRERGTVLFALGMAALALAAAWALQRWFAVQPGGRSDQLSISFLLREGDTWNVRVMGTLFAISTAMMLFPVSLGGLALLRRPSRVALACTAGALALVMLTMQVWGDEPHGRHTRNKYVLLGNTVSSYGIMGSSHNQLNGKPPLVLSGKLVGLAVSSSLAAFLLVAGSLGRTWGLLLREQWAPAAILVLAAASYLGLVLIFSLVYPVFDRYAMGMLPPVGLLLMMALRRAGCERVPVAAWVVLALYTGYTVASTHDYFAERRLRTTMIAQLMAAGTPRNQLSGGWEFDGHTQVLATGFIGKEFNKDIAHTKPEPSVECSMFIYDLTPSVNPAVAITYPHPHPECITGVVSKHEYRTWLPPQRRELWVVKR